MKVKFLFAWYDLWVGLFWDRAKRRLYVLPVPCVGIVIEFGETKVAAPGADLASLAKAVTSHGLPLRKAANVSEEAMERVYAELRGLSYDHLARMFSAADPHTPHGLLVRHQIAFTVEKKLEGKW